MSEPGPVDHRLPAVELRSIAARLRDRISADSADVRAYLLLHRDGELRPSTPQALEVWRTEGGGAWSGHHLAIAAHALAYEREASAERAERAERKNKNTKHTKHHRADWADWAGALRAWAEVHRDDAFWSRMRDHLGTVMGAPFPEDVLRSVRARLPRDLFAPNIARAEELLATRPKTAAEHIRAIRESGFAAAVIADVRKEFAAAAVDAALVAGREGRHGEAVNALRLRLAADPTNPALVRSLLFIGRSRMEALVIEPDWHHRSAPFLRKVDRLLAPYLKELGTASPPPEIRAELARIEFFFGLELFQEHAASIEGSATTLRGARTAAEHIERALELDPGLPEAGRLYHDAEGCLVGALLIAANSTLKLRYGDAAVRRLLNQALEHRDALMTDQQGAQQLALMIILGLSQSTRGELLFGEELVARLRADPDVPADIRFGVLPQMGELLAQRRRWAY